MRRANHTPAATRPVRFFSFLFIISIGLLAIHGCAADKAATGPAGPPPAVPVSVTKAVSKSVPVEIQTVGNVEAYSTISVKAQIGGVLTRVGFEEGANVRKGDLLFVIDQRPYQAQVAQSEASINRDRAQLRAAQANLARDTAQQDYADGQSKRYAELFEKGIMPKETSEQMTTQATALAGSVQADRAAIESVQANLAADQAALERARLDLEYCTITSPIDGRTGHLAVKQGNVVKANDVELVTINQLRPIFVTFSVPEINLPTIKAHMSSGRIDVQAVAEGDSTGETGKLTFIENAVDSATGTIRMKATFDNPDSRLWPGQFVRVVLRLNVSANAVVLPLPALQTGQDGKFVFVLKPDMTVDARPVVAGRTVDRDVVIEKGINAGETVVTEGQLRLAQGSKVQVKTAQ
jgi:multidrug efflux system membrane fusion protein